LKLKIEKSKKLPAKILSIDSSDHPKSSSLEPASKSSVVEAANKFELILKMDMKFGLRLCRNDGARVEIPTRVQVVKVACRA